MTESEWEQRGRLVGETPEDLKVQTSRRLTVGNAISLLRVVLLPFLLHAIAQPIEEAMLTVVVLSVTIAMTDMLDGLVARRLNQVSELGRVFDPVADKICTGTGTIWLYMYRGLPLWIVLLVVGRDVLILIGSVLVARKRRVVMPSAQIGRVTTTVLTVTLFIYVIDWTWPQQVLVIASGILVASSFVVYYRIGRQMLRKI